MNLSAQEGTHHAPLRSLPTLPAEPHTARLFAGCPVNSNDTKRPHSHFVSIRSNFESSCDSWMPEFRYKTKGTMIKTEASLQAQILLRIRETDSSSSKVLLEIFQLYLQKIFSEELYLECRYGNSWCYLTQSDCSTLTFIQGHMKCFIYSPQNMGSLRNKHISLND